MTTQNTCNWKLSNDTEHAQQYTVKRSSMIILTICNVKLASVIILSNCNWILSGSIIRYYGKKFLNGTKKNRCKKNSFLNSNITYNRKFLLSILITYFFTWVHSRVAQTVIWDWLVHVKKHKNYSTECRTTTPSDTLQLHCLTRSPWKGGSSKTSTY